jgi:nicotinamidase-related amidase/type 1 glutamine amidotransferase
MLARTFSVVALLVTAFTFTPGADTSDSAASAAGSPGTLMLTLRSRTPSSTEKETFDVLLKKEEWHPKKTAIIVCDMWDSHHCQNAAKRVEEIAPRMNLVLEKARSQGVTIIHAPSSCMAAYKDHPGRKRAQDAPKAATLPKDIGVWCYKIPSEEKGIYPVEQGDGGCDTEPEAQKAWEAKLKDMGRNPKAPWLKQIDALKIANEDYISDSGVEIWNVLQQRGLANVILVGVHTNMCVLGRPFGLRQMAKNGKHVVLMRDMTDTMYNPNRWPYVAHFQGTDLIVQHIEKYVCPTITSDQILGGAPFRFKDDVRPKVVVAIAEPEYDTPKTLPPLVQRVFVDQLGFEATILHGDNKKMEIPGFAKAVAKADLVVLSVRRLAPVPKDLEALKKHLDAGKPLMGIRTASHAFDAKGKFPEGHAEWVKFDPEVLGGNYKGHHGTGIIANIEVGTDLEAKPHPVLYGLKTPFPSKGSLYKTMPLAPSATPLLMGTIPNQQPECVAWVNTYKKAKVFYTSLGYREDFENPQFVLLIHNAARWCTGMRVGKE